MKFFAGVLLLTSLTVFGSETDQSTSPAAGVIQRTFGAVPFPYQFKKIEKEKDCDQFGTQVQNNALEIRGSSPVALCRGFYDFVKQQHMGIVSWSGTRFNTPATLADQPLRHVVSPVEHHYYFNVVTYGYTMPYWNWARWEKEIDWMALHGIDMPLALCANEAISVRVWKRLGLTDTEINEFYVGPAHLPWHRMGNIINHDGPIPAEWHTDQIALQHKILDRMRALEMKPICPAFAGFVPRGLKRIYPDVKMDLLSWGGFPEKNRASILSAADPLFVKIGTMFIEEWEKEFGKCQYYLADMFNEMELPVPKNDKAKRYEMLAQFGETGYKSITTANPDAIWVMQGWMFGYSRHIWDPATLKALTSKVPDNKMILLDLAVDYSKIYWRNGVNWDFYSGFFNKEWVYSVIPNMGGKCGHTGVLEFYANGHLEALRSANRGKLVGIGMAPEGIQNNEIIYELLTDAAWKSSETNLQNWLENYAKCRYGAYPASLKKAYDFLLTSVYGSFTDHPLFNWQLQPPATRGSINVSDSYLQGLTAFAESAEALKGSPLFLTDLEDFIAMYIGVKMQMVSSRMVEAVNDGEIKTADKLMAQFRHLAQDADNILRQHPILNLKIWTTHARDFGSTRALKDYYESNARRLITVWGPPTNDYAAKIWGGLISTYYLKRWELWLDMQKGNVTDQARRQFELDWVNTPGLGAEPVTRNTADEMFAFCRNALKSASQIQLPPSKVHPLAGQWNPQTVTTEWKTVSFDIPTSGLKKLDAIRFKYLRGGHRLDVRNLVLEGDGKVLFKTSQSGYAGTPSRNNLFEIKIPTDAVVNNSCQLKVEIRTEGGNDSFGNIELIFSE